MGSKIHSRNKQILTKSIKSIRKKCAVIYLSCGTKREEGERGEWKE